MRVLMLTNEAHGRRGGIAQYNRDILATFEAMPAIGEVLVLTRLIDDPDFSAPAKVRYDRAAARGKLAFVWRVLVAVLTGGPFDLVFCGHVNLMPVAAIARRLTGARLIVAVHGTEVWQPLAGPGMRAALPKADMILSVSQFTVDRMAQWYDGVRRLARVIPNTVRTGQFGIGPRNAALAARFGIGERRVVLTFGRMAADERAKGFDKVIEAMPELARRAPDLVYLCAGDGDDRPRLEGKVVDMGLQRAVIFTGLVREEEKADLYRLADAFVLASRGEGFGIVLLEAMACGIPVVGSTLDATQEALLFGELGPAVDPRDAGALAAAILAAIERPKAVPPGIDHYSFDKFRARIEAAVLEVVAP